MPWIFSVYVIFLSLLPLAVDVRQFFPFEPFKVALFGAITAAFAAISVVRAAWLGPLPAPGDIFRKFTPTDRWVAAYIFSLALGTAFSVDPSTSLLGSAERATGLYFWLSCGTAYVLLRMKFDEKTLGLFARGTVVAASLAGVYAILQHYGTDIAIFRGTFLLYGRSGPTRSFSTLGHPNFLGAWLAMALPVLASSALKERPMAWRAISMASVAISICAVAFTYSRGAWIATISGMTAFALLYSPRLRVLAKKHAITISGVVLAGAAILAVSAPYLARSSSPMAYKVGTAFDFNNGSTLARINEWKHAASLIAARPVAGYGIDTYMNYAAGRIKDPRERNRDFIGPDPSVADRLHNIVLDTLWSGGILALTSLLGIVFAAAYRIRQRMHLAARGERVILASWCGALTAYVVGNMVSFDFSISGIWFAVGLAAIQYVKKT